MVDGDSSLGLCIVILLLMHIIKNCVLHCTQVIKHGVLHSNALSNLVCCTVNAYYQNCVLHRTSVATCCTFVQSTDVCKKGLCWGFPGTIRRSPVLVCWNFFRTAFSVRNSQVFLPVPL